MTSNLSSKLELLSLLSSALFRLVERVSLLLLKRSVRIVNRG